MHLRRGRVWGRGNKQQLQQPVRARTKGRADWSGRDVDVLHTACMQVYLPFYKVPIVASRKRRCRRPRRSQHAFFLLCAPSSRDQQHEQPSLSTRSLYGSSVSDGPVEPRAASVSGHPTTHHAHKQRRNVDGRDRPSMNLAPHARRMGSTANQPRASWHARPAQSSTSNIAGTPSPHARLFHFRVDSAALPWMARPGRASLGTCLCPLCSLRRVHVHPTSNLMLLAVDEQVAAPGTPILPEPSFLMRTIGRRRRHDAGI